MPTAAKLFAALAFAAVGFFAAEAFKPALPEGTQFGFFTEICAALGALCGWRISGALAGKGYYASSGYGVRTSVTIVFWALLGFSIYEMVLRSMKLRYDGPFEAVVAVFDLAYGYLLLMGRSDFLIILVAGGILGGMLTEWASRRWS